MTRIINGMKEHSLVLFFLLAFAISWTIWLPQVAFVQGFVDKPVSPYLHLAGGLGPMLAAIIVIGLISGGNGIREHIRQMFHWRVRMTWHLLAWFGPVVLFVIAAVIVRITGGTWPELSQFGRTEEYPELPLVVYWMANMLFYGWGEETGWRGFALPRLQKNHNPLTATFILSVCWALWHLPLFWCAAGFMEMGLGGAIGWYFSLLLGAVLLTWIYNGSKGSILIVAIFHGVLNIVFSSPFSGNLATIMGMLMTLWGVIVLLAYKPASHSQAKLHVLN
jgi:uncharacterized protein